MTAEHGAGRSRSWFQIPAQTAARRIECNDRWAPARWQRSVFSVFENLSKAFFNLDFRNLLRIKFDDHSFLDRQIDIFPLRQAEDLSSNGLTVHFKPVWSSTAADEFHGAGNLDVLLHLFLERNLVTGDDLIGRYVDLLT